MDMNLANKLTMLRVVMIPAFLLVLFLAPEPMNRYIAVIIFIVASLTDMLDGKIARKYNMVSNFGEVIFFSQIQYCQNRVNSTVGS